jgi:hypothetical protein
MYASLEVRQYHPVSKAVFRDYSTCVICRCRGLCHIEGSSAQSIQFKADHLHVLCDTLLASSDVDYAAHLLPPLVLELRPRSRLLRKLSMLGRRELELERRRL